MKTTTDIHDELLARAKRLAKETGQPVRAVVEDGFRLVRDSTPARGFSLSDLRRGDPNAPDPLARYAWQEFRELIYGDAGTRWSP